MSRPHNTPDSYSPLLLDLAFIDENGQTVSIQPSKYLQSLTIEEPTKGAWTGSMVLFDIDGDTLEDLFAASTLAQRQVRFSFGWDRGNGVRDARVYQALVTTYQPKFDHMGTELTLELLGRLAIEAVSDKVTRSYAEGTKVSDIVRAIVADRKWRAEQDGKSTIEDTDGTLTKPVSTDNESDLAFILNQLLPLAVNNNKEPMHCYIDEDTLHFHSPAFLLPKGKAELAAVYRFSRDQMGDVISFAPQDLALLTALRGGENATYTAVLSKDGTTQVLQSTKDGGPDNVIVANPDEAFLPSQGPGIKAIIRVAARDEAEFRTEVARMVSSRRNMAFQAVLEVRGTAMVRVMDLVRVEVLKRDGQPHYMSGVFTVYKVSHSISAGSWTTSFELMRGGRAMVDGDTAENRVAVDKSRSVGEGEFTGWSARATGDKSGQGNEDTFRKSVKDPDQR